MLYNFFLFYYYWRIKKFIVSRLLYFTISFYVDFYPLRTIFLSLIWNVNIKQKQNWFLQIYVSLLSWLWYNFDFRGWREGFYWAPFNEKQGSYGQRSLTQCFPIFFELIFSQLYIKKYTISIIFMHSLFPYK